MNSYRRLNQTDRIRTKGLLSAGLSQTRIADKLKVHKSTISTEIKRNSGLRGYRPKQTQKKAEQRQNFRSNLRKWNPILKKQVKVLLKKKWSPEQISSRLKLEKKGLSVIKGFMSLLRWISFPVEICTRTPIRLKK